MKRAVLALLVACGPRHVAPPHDEWAQPPRVTLERPRLPAITERQIDGLRVIVAENHRLPLVTFAAVSLSAGGRAGWQTPGIATLTTDVIAASSDGFVPERTIATEYSALEVTARTEDVDAAATALANAIRNPDLDDKTLSFIREIALPDTVSHSASSRTFAGRLLDRILFGAHPYEVPPEGTFPSVKRITIDEIRAFWQSAWAPGTLTLVIVGDVDNARVERIAHSFAMLAGDHPKLDAPALPAYSPKLGVYDLPGATTSVVLVGTRSDPAGPQQIAGDIANLLLGGPDARLDQVLHDKLRVTLGAGSSYWRGLLAGSWSVAASFPTDRTIEGLRATVAEIKHARDEVPSATDVTRAKERLLRALATSFETNVGATRVLERMIGQGLPSDWYATYVKRLDAITPDDVHAAATKWNDLSIVVVGDWQKLKSELTSFGLPVTMYEP